MATIGTPKLGSLGASPPKAGGVASNPVDTSKGLFQVREVKAHTTLGYGKYGCLKTWNALKFAEYMLRRTGKITRYVYSDMGGYEELKAAHDAGLIELTNLAHNQSPMAAIYKLARGEWPQIVDGKFAGYRPWDANDAARVGAYVFDSLTQICFQAMAEMVESGRKVSEDVVGAFQVFEEHFGLVSRGHYNQAQHLAKNFLRMVAQLPVERVYITALEQSGLDEAKQTVYGPDVAGRALTEKIPSDIGDTLHLMKDDNTGEVRLYFGFHRHPINKVEMITNIRLSGETRQKWMAEHPDGYYVVGEDTAKGGMPPVSVVKFLECQDSASTTNKAAWAEMVAKFKKGGETDATVEAN